MGIAQRKGAVGRNRKVVTTARGTWSYTRVAAASAKPLTWAAAQFMLASLPHALRNVSMGARHSGHSGPVAGSPKLVVLPLAQYAARRPQQPRQARWPQGAIAMSAGRSRHTGQVEPSAWLAATEAALAPC